MTARHGFRRGASVVARLLVLWLLVTLIFWAATAVMPGISVPSFGAALLTTALIALINALLWPLLIRLFLPLTVLTFGLGSLVMTAVITSVSIDLVDGTAPDFLAAVLVSVVLSVSLCC